MSILITETQEERAILTSFEASVNEVFRKVTPFSYILNSFFTNGSEIIRE